MLRAVGGKAGIYGNDAIEATYPITKTLANGEALHGSKHNYTLIFTEGQYPPVNAFWSVTMYDGKAQFLIENPINRYLIKLADAAQPEEESGRLADDLHSEQVARPGQGIELVASAE